MCGIIGAIGKFSLPANVDKFVKNALVVDAVRGAHSTGVCLLTQVNGKRFWEVRKEAVNGSDFIEHIYDPVVDNRNTYAVIGHNRYATIGGITNDTAHPFKVGDVIGVHNGTLTGDWRKALQAPKAMEVDSNAMIHSIMHRGYKRTFESMSGAVATVWTNIRTNTTYCYRNAQRPLHYAITTGGVLIYGSEKLMLEWLIDRNKITIKGNVESFKVNTVYEITDGEVKELEEVHTFRPPTTTYNTSRTSGYSAGSRSGNAWDDPEYWGYSEEDINDSSFDNTPPVPEREGATVSINEPNNGRTIAYEEIPSVSGVYPMLGGDKIPTRLEMYGAGYAAIRNMMGLPIRVPLNMTNDQLKRLGWSTQKGVFFRGTKVTSFERQLGISGEYADLDQDSAMFCDFTGQELENEYLETGTGAATLRICLDFLADFQTTYAEPCDFIKIIRKNVAVLLPVGEKTA